MNEFLWGLLTGVYILCGLGTIAIWPHFEKDNPPFMHILTVAWWPLLMVVAGISFLFRGK